MATLTQILTALVADAFQAEGLDPALGVVTTSDRPDLAQFQCNGALAAAKAAKANPKAIADKIVARLSTDPRFAKIEIAGPGFINLTLTDATIAAHIDRLRDDPRCGVPTREHPQTVLIDFGGPNIAKTMHAGHLRSLVIGDALARLFRFAGDKVITDVHFGDWGLQMGQLITELKHERGNDPEVAIYFDETNTGPFPNTHPPVTMEDLERLYPKASAACKADPARLDEARKATAELQAGRPGYRALWEHFRGVSFAGVRREFDALDIHFDWWKGESDVDKLVAPMVADLQKRGLAELSEGALVIHITEPGDKKELPPLIVQKTDGAALYETTDLATIIDRVKTADPDLILYVVGQPQHDHFEKVFRGARKANLTGKATLEHIGFGTVNGPDGKPFRTRAGGTVKLFDLIEQAKEEALNRLNEAGLATDYPPAEREEIARQVGLAAIKFADLQNHRLTNYVFDLARFTKFEGETGPYLQYAAVRSRSLLRKAGTQGFQPGPVRLDGHADCRLALVLDRISAAIDQSAAKRAPNVLCAYAFELAQEFSRFWAAHHILSGPGDVLRASRLSLCAMTLARLQLALSLLGIEVPERM
ncbi:MAG: arginine--tRNA ligase [Alphaproteobacteria bacterium]|nr:arginine--tRNA ligase [Alphaproteobacteria bacterium]